jgi:hypothetical protein
LAISLSYIIPERWALQAKAATAGNFARANSSPFCCPLTARPMNGKFRFVALKPSGHVFAAEALKGGLRAAVEDMIGAPRWVTLRARWVTLKSSLGGAESSLGDAKSSLGGAEELAGWRYELAG